MINKLVKDEIEALEHAINHPSERDEYLSVFWNNADLLLQAMKLIPLKEVKHVRKAG